MSSVLMIEDEERISEFVRRGLTMAGFQFTVVANGREGVREAGSGLYDLVLLDVGLPGIDGFEVLRRIRLDDEAIPVIMLTARNSAQDTVLGLDSGANDYLPKPFVFEELLARIRLRLRDSVKTPATVLRRGSLSLDVATRSVKIDDRPVVLSLREFSLAEEFLRQPGEMLRRDVLLTRVWGQEMHTDTNVVDLYVSYLRNKLGPERIETVRDEGYRLV